MARHDRFLSVLLTLLIPCCFSSANYGTGKIILMAHRKSLLSIDLNQPRFIGKELPLKNLSSAITVDYDPVSNVVYWADSKTGTIQRARPDGSDQQVVAEVEIPGCVAVDTITGNVHWVDEGKQRIEAARLDGSSRTVLIGTGLDRPRGLALDPAAGFMYWTDWGDSPRVERSFLDGTRRETLADTGLGWPNGIALDLKRRTVYWCDAKMDRIEVANMDGTGRRVLVNNVRHCFGLALLDHFIYWTDWAEKALERAHKVTGGQREKLTKLDSAMGIAVMSGPSSLSSTNDCLGHNGGCVHLCLYTPDGATCRPPSVTCSEDGLLADPTSSRHYLSCLNGTATRLDCGQHRRFNSQTGQCSTSSDGSEFER